MGSNFQDSRFLLDSVPAWWFAQKVMSSKKDAQDLMETIGAAMAAEMSSNLIQVLSSTPAPTPTTLQWTGATTALLEPSKTSVHNSLSDKNWMDTVESNSSTMKTIAIVMTTEPNFKINLGFRWKIFLY